MAGSMGEERGASLASQHPSLSLWMWGMKVFAVSANKRQIKFSSINNITSLYCFGMSCLLPSISLLILIFPKVPKQLNFC